MVAAVVTVVVEAAVVAVQLAVAMEEHYGAMGRRAKRDECKQLIVAVPQARAQNGTKRLQWTTRKMILCFCNSRNNHTS